MCGPLKAEFQLKCLRPTASSGQVLGPRLPHVAPWAGGGRAAGLRGGGCVLR